MKQKELKEKWDELLENLYQENRLDDIQISTFFKPLLPIRLSEKEGKLYLKCSNNNPTFYQNKVVSYYNEIKDAVFAVFGKEYTIEVTDDGEIEEEESDNQIREDRLNPEYTFESFVKGPNNNFACAASLAVAEGYSKKYNPLFIYGGPGLGKTHLMHAIGQYVKQNKPKKKVLYVNSETFVNELSEAIRTSKQQQFKDKYRRLDYLLFDDVQFIAGKKFIEEELFNTFDALLNAGKQLVFTSDQHPTKIDNLPERITSRFAWGISVDIQPPEYETRLAILKNKALLNNVDVSNEKTMEALELIAQNTEGNIRELEGAFSRVLGFSLIMNQEINVSLTKKVLSDLFKPKNEKISAEKIKKSVASYFGIKVADMESSVRSRKVAYPRQIAIYLIREMLESSFPQIGEMFGGRDHTTIMHSYEKICEEIKSSKELYNTINTIKEKISE